MKAAYFGIPHIGGPFTVYRSLRQGLADRGMEMRWLALGPDAHKATADPLWIDELQKGLVVAGHTRDEAEQAVALAAHVESAGYDAVLISIGCGKVESNIARYLSASVRRVMLVHTLTVATYAGARAVRDHVHATICVSPRIRSDLIQKHGFSVERTHVIPTAIDISAFECAQRTEPPGKSLRVLSLGRIIDTDKGVFWLPTIMDHLAKDDIRLTVAGDGPDLEELQRRCAHLGDRVRFIGRVAPEQVPAVLAAHDVFLFPSRFEGLGLSLVEAMAAGCVPVASRIKGVTDFVVNDGVDGILYPIGNVGAAARAVAALAADRSRLAQLSAAAQENVRVRFDLAGMAEAYYKVLTHVANNPPPLPPPLPLEQWHYPRALLPGLRTALPAGLKKWLRLWRERLA